MSMIFFKSFQWVRKEKTPKFVPSPEFEKRVEEINSEIKLLFVVKLSALDYCGREFDDATKVRFLVIESKIQSMIQEEGEEFRLYLLPWKGKQSPAFRDLARVRVANCLRT